MNNPMKMGIRLYKKRDGHSMIVATDLVLSDTEVINEA